MTDTVQPHPFSTVAHCTTRAAQYVLALLLGMLSSPAYAPLGWWPLQIISLSLLAFWLTRPMGPVRGFAIGLAYGYGMMAIGLYSMYITFHVYCELNPVLSVIASVILNGYLAAYYGLACAATRYLASRWQKISHGTSVMTGSRPALCTSLLILPACWTLSEWFRGWLLTGFPWLAAGYAHTSSPLTGFAPVVGVYGISFCVMLMAGLIALAIRHLYRWHTNRSDSVLYGLLFTVLALILAVGGQVLRHIAWTRPAGQEINVELIQGNIPQEIKFTVSQAGPILQWYADTINASHADLVVTPETAIPVYPQELDHRQLQAFAHQADQRDQVLAIGFPTADLIHQRNSKHKGRSDTSMPFNSHNSVLVFSGPENATTPYHYTYQKTHLLPFGEYAPTGLGWFVDLLHIPLGDLQAGDSRQPPFAVKNQWIMPTICYEDLFGEELAGRLKHAAADGSPVPTILLNLSDISWFGYTWVVPLHLQSSQMRALETGRPMVRATNTGATAVINPQGEVLQVMPFYTRGTLKSRVQGYAGLTPYVLTGNSLIIGITLFCLLGSFLLLRYRVGHSSPKKS